MTTVIITLVAVLLVAMIIFAVTAGGVRKTKQPPREKLDQDYIYRKEPHADQVAEKPNKLDDNPVTKG